MNAWHCKNEINVEMLQNRNKILKAEDEMLRLLQESEWYGEPKSKNKDWHKNCCYFSLRGILNIKKSGGR